MTASLEALYLPAPISTSGSQSQRFALLHRPARSEPKGLIVYVHPLCEEMNKSRRMAAMQSRAFAEAGFAVLQLDLLGCGDSSGDFGDATWSSWVDDVRRAALWLHGQHAGRGHGDLPMWLWGLRAGCLLAAEAARQLSAPCNLLLWQPTISGDAMLRQFLRLRLAGDMIGGKGKGAMQSLLQSLAAGESIEVAGYALHPALAHGLGQAALKPPDAPPAVPPDTPRQVAWIDIAAQPQITLSPATAKRIDIWQQAGWRVHHSQVSGPAFWQTTEIEDAPALIAASLDALAPA